DATDPAVREEGGVEGCSGRPGLVLGHGSITSWPGAWRGGWLGAADARGRITGGAEASLAAQASRRPFISKGCNRCPRAEARAGAADHRACISQVDPGRPWSEGVNIGAIYRKQPCG
ncbi:hypothetical protein CEJ06_24485, partial [Salmonella enterica]|nr:hypothetical protein [Salmonella enterica]